MLFNHPARYLEKDLGNTEQLLNQIQEGEHTRQDFKFRIDSSVKIARTLSSFANTLGGKILIGVKDNGHVAGIDLEEEYFMIEGAASVFCNPPVPFSACAYQYEDKLVLEINVASSKLKPHLAKEPDGAWRAYIRQEDENFMANGVLVQYMRIQNPTNRQKGLISYGDHERKLWDYLQNNEAISLSKFSKICNISIKEAEQILVLFLKWELIKWQAHQNGIQFKLIE